MSSDEDTLRHLITNTLLGPDFVRATFGGAQRGRVPSAWRQVHIRPLELRGLRHLQFAYFDAKKNITKNYRPDEVLPPLEELLAHGFAGMHLTTTGEEIDIQRTKKGKILIGRRSRPEAAGDIPTAHNRVKDVPLPEGQAHHLLEVLGIATSTGQVRPTMRAKYTQINEFLRQIEYAVEVADLGHLGRPLTILDCGCGSSYLTLATHYYLNERARIPAQIIGVDVNDEVIRKSMAKAERLGTAQPTFTCDTIGNLATKADVVLALHACDTATDDAIAQAVRGEARVLLSVPCCHHLLNEQLRATGPAEVMRPLLRHGILHQRTADLVTDAFRALALRIMGYRTEVIEFISTEHTARNLMIRAINGAPMGEREWLREYRELRQFWGVVPYIETALGAPFRVLVAC